MFLNSFCSKGFYSFTYFKNLSLKERVHREAGKLHVLLQEISKNWNERLLLTRRNLLSRLRAESWASLGVLDRRDWPLWNGWAYGANSSMVLMPFHVCSVGVPSAKNMSRNWSSTTDPGNNGLPFIISNIIHPTPLIIETTHINFQLKKTWTYLKLIRICTSK